MENLDNINCHQLGADLNSILYGLSLSSNIYRISPIPLPVFTVYIVNFPFDFLAMYVTLHVLKIITKANSFTSLIAIILDILIAGILVIICFVSIMFVDDLAFSNQWWGSGYRHAAYSRLLKEINKDALIRDGFSEKATFQHFAHKTSPLEYLKIGLNSYKNVLVGKNYKFRSLLSYKVKEGTRNKTYHTELEYGHSWQSITTPLTTFVPTLLYMTLLLALIIGKIIIEAIMHLLDLMTEPNPDKDPKDFIPGTLFKI